jgi:hypothetical protein
MKPTYRTVLLSFVLGLVVGGIIAVGFSRSESADDKYTAALQRTLKLTINEEVAIDYNTGIDHSLDEIMGVELPKVYNTSWLKAKRILVNTKHTIWDEGHHFILEIDEKGWASLTRCDISPKSGKGCTVYSENRLVIVYSFLWTIRPEGTHEDIYAKAIRSLPFINGITTYGLDPVQLKVN